MGAGKVLWLLVVCLALVGTLAQDRKVESKVESAVDRETCADKDCTPPEEIIEQRYGAKFTTVSQRERARESCQEEKSSNGTYKLCAPNLTSVLRRSLIPNLQFSCPWGWSSDRSVCCETCRRYVRFNPNSPYVVHMPWVNRYQYLDYGICWKRGDCFGSGKKCTLQRTWHQVLMSTMPINNQLDLIHAIIHNALYWQWHNLPNYCKCIKTALPWSAVKKEIA